MNSLNKPFVSILMTAYNREELIVEAIESVLNCGYTNSEVIIVDDCSTDNTFKVIEKYALKESKIRHYQNKKNLGDYANRNRAASYARGEYITYVDSDDKMLPGGLEECMDAMLRYPNAGIGMYWPKVEESSFLFSKKEAIKHHFFKYPFLVVGPGATILKRSFFESLNGYPTKYGPANDMYFNLKAACHTDVVLFSFKFFFYRVHDLRESNNWYKYLYFNYLFLKDALAELPFLLSAKEKKWIENKNKRRFSINLVRHLFSTGSFREVAGAIKKTGFSLRDVFNGIFH